MITSCGGDEPLLATLLERSDSIQSEYEVCLKTNASFLLVNVCCHFAYSIRQDWAERLRSLLYMNSVVIIHQAETQEFFTPLLKPWVHFMPTNLYMDDLISNIKWARENDQYAQQIVRNQNAFADRYITERSMQQYWEVALEEFSVRQAKAAGVGTRSNE